MPFKSEAQRAKFAQLVKDGKMSQETFDRWQAETPADIPEKSGPMKFQKAKKIKRIR